MNCRAPSHDVDERRVIGSLVKFEPYVLIHLAREEVVTGHLVQRLLTGAEAHAVEVEVSSVRIGSGPKTLAESLRPGDADPVRSRTAEATGRLIRNLTCHDGAGRV